MKTKINNIITKKNKIVAEFPLLFNITTADEWTKQNIWCIIMRKKKIERKKVQHTNLNASGSRLEWLKIIQLHWKLNNSEQRSTVRSEWVKQRSGDSKRFNIYWHSTAITTINVVSFTGCIYKVFFFIFCTTTTT